MIIALLAALQSASLTAPPADKEAPQCFCRAGAAQSDVYIRGYPLDGEVWVDETGRNPRPRQTTIFRIIYAKGVEAETPFRVWHMTTPEKCGVTFDYGKQYKVPLRKKGDAYETDKCLVEAAAE